VLLYEFNNFDVERCFGKPSHVLIFYFFHVNLNNNNTHPLNTVHLISVDNYSVKSER